MSVDPNTLESFTGKKVILHLCKDDSLTDLPELVELEGKVEDASDVGMAFKESGKRDVQLIMPEQIEEIALAPEKAKKVSQKKLKPIAESNVRQHLVDRHGYARSVINEMSDEAGLELHDKIDHKDLGHKHVADDDESEDQNEAGESDSDETTDED